MKTLIFTVVMTSEHWERKAESQLIKSLSSRESILKGPVFSPHIMSFCSSKTLVKYPHTIISTKEWINRREQLVTAGEFTERMETLCWEMLVKQILCNMGPIEVFWKVGCNEIHQWLQHVVVPLVPVVFFCLLPSFYVCILCKYIYS